MGGLLEELMGETLTEIKDWKLLEKSLFTTIEN